MYNTLDTNNMSVTCNCRSTEHEIFRVSLYS